MKVKQILDEKQTQEAIQRGVDKLYDVAAAAYGAKGGNVLLKHEYGDPSLSRDGVTNVDKVYLPDQAENMAARVVVQASKKNNETVGDGTTLAVILTKHLLDAARTLHAGGVYDRMAAAEALEAIVAPVHEQLDKLSKKVDRQKLIHVATISSGNAGTGAMIADSIDKVGLDGGVVVERSAGLATTNELIDGFYFPKGFVNAWLINNRAQMKAEHNEANILIVERGLSGLHEMAHIMDTCANNGMKRIVVVGEVTGQALECVLGNHIGGRFDMTIVEPPTFAGARSLFLQDLATFTGGQVITEGMTVEEFDVSMLGHAKKVVVGEFNTSIIGGHGAGEDIKSRVAELKKQLKGEKDSRSVEIIQDRLAKLTSKICIIRVGGATPIDADYNKLRVDDAVCAVRSAMRSGVLPGGGVALVRCKEAAGKFGSAFDEPFKQLFKNAGLNAERYLADVEKAEAWFGFNLKNITEQPLDLLTEGVVDPLEVIKEAVTNAASMAAKLITAKASIIDDNDADTNKPSAVN